MTTAEAKKVATPAPFTVLNVVLDSGERLPCLVESATWIPVRVATRWAVRYRRYRVQASTLGNNLRVLARVYGWAQDCAGLDLDDLLTQGQILRNREIKSLVNSLRAKADTHTLDTGALDQHLAVVEDFVKWSLDSENRGGRCVLSLERLTAERQRMEEFFRSFRVGARPSTRIEPLEEADIEAIRRAIGPRRDSGSHLLFPSVFSCHTQLCNWLMFEVALELGIRRGELLKLRLDSLPRAAEEAWPTFTVNTRWNHATACAQLPWRFSWSQASASVNYSPCRLTARSKRYGAATHAIDSAITKKKLVAERRCSPFAG